MDNAYRIEIAHFLIAFMGFLLAVWNAYDDWQDCGALDLSTDNARVVMRAYEHAAISVLIVLMQFTSVTIATVLVQMPPPPLPTLIRPSEDTELLTELMRATAMTYAGLVMLSVLLIAKSSFRRVSRHIYTRSTWSVGDGSS